MRALSATQAARCEAAANHRCRCRCGGAFHGANRWPARGSRPGPDDVHATAFYDKAELRAAKKRLAERDPRQLEIA